MYKAVCYMLKSDVLLANGIDWLTACHDEIVFQINALYGFYPVGSL